MASTSNNNKGVGSDTPHPQTSNEFAICSWNPTGSNTAKLNWLAEYCEEYNIKCAMIQEHFKCSNNSLSYFRKEFKNFNISCKNAVRKENELRG